MRSPISLLLSVALCLFVTIICDFAAFRLNSSMSSIAFFFFFLVHYTSSRIKQECETNRTSKKKKKNNSARVTLSRRWIRRAGVYLLFFPFVCVCGALQFRHPHAVVLVLFLHFSTAVLSFHPILLQQKQKGTSCSPRLKEASALFPTPSASHSRKRKRGETGNRTRVFRATIWCSATELFPRATRPKTPEHTHIEQQSC